jgi:HPt (histidine-containing phosphotransfer) domain-containing protein
MSVCRNDTPVPEAVDTEVGDLGAIARLRKWGGETLVTQMWTLFATEVPTRLDAARRGIHEGDIQAVERAAHSLRSSCSQLGARRMRSIAEEIEVLSAGGVLEHVPSLLLRLEAEFTTFSNWMETATRSSGKSIHV